MPSAVKDNRLLYTPDEEVIHEIQTHYSKILDQAALNVSSPLAANIGFFNNSGKVFADPARVGKTLVFMTRPNLNLRTFNNLRRSRILQYTASTKIGSTLMRYLMYGKTADMLVYGYYPTTGNLTSDFEQKVPIIGSTIDSVLGGTVLKEGVNSYPIIETNFVPMVTNLCTNVSNAKDLTMDVFETDGNMNGDRLAYATGVDENFSIGEITLTFNDIYSSPVMTYFYPWMMYMHYVGKGICDPEWAYIVNRIIDYTVSIYVFVLGTDQQTILHWTKYSGCFPRSLPFGQIQHSTEIDQQSLNNVSVPFQYNFSNPDDPLVLAEFNMLSDPSLFYRFSKATFKHTEHKKTLISNLSGHNMNLAQALLVRELCPPNKLPEKLIEGYSKYNNDLVDNFAEDDGSTLNKYSFRRLNLVNRQADHIENNWAGVPYICEGNRLLWL